MAINKNVCVRFYGLWAPHDTAGYLTLEDGQPKITGSYRRAMQFMSRYEAEKYAQDFCHTTRGVNVADKSEYPLTYTLVSPLDA